MGDRRWAMDDERRPMLCIVDEGPQLLRSTDGPGDDPGYGPVDWR